MLAALRRAGEPYSLTPTELYRSMMLSSAAMTNRLDRLEGSGLVYRSPDPDDRRGVLITLTEEGLALVEEAVRAHVENEEMLLSSLSLRERDELAGLLRKLSVSMEASREARGSLPSHHQARSAKDRSGDRRSRGAAPSEAHAGGEVLDEIGRLAGEPDPP